MSGSRISLLNVTVMVCACVRMHAQTEDCRPAISAVPDQIVQAGSPPVGLTFMVGDQKTPADQLVVTAVSGNQELVPDSSFQFGPIDPDNTSLRKLAFQPNVGRSGVATVTLTVKDEDGCAASTAFKITVPNPPPPAISRISDQTIQAGGSTGPIAFTVNDQETFPGFLTIEKTSSNKTFVPDENIVLAGSGSARTVTVTGAPGQEGSATITITIKNARGETARADFVVATPLPPQCLPTISSIPNQTTAANQPAPPIAFKVDAGSPTASILSVLPKSSNQTLVPDTNIVINGTGMDRTVVVSPARDQVGQAMITITLTTSCYLGQTPLAASTSFTLSVAAPGPPTISSVPNQTSRLGDLQNIIVEFRVGSNGEEVAGLKLAARSSNQALVPDQNIFMGGTGARRTLFIPSFNQAGTTTITVTVTDSGGQTASTSFNWIVIPPPPRLRESRFDSNGQFQFNVSGSPSGLKFLVQASSDLREWTTVATNSLSANGSQFVDSATNRLQRFYRAVLLP